MPQPEENEIFVATQLNPGALEADLRYALDAEVRFDAGSRALYATDASNYRQIPIGVVLPRTTEAVIKTLEICHRHGAPVVSRGGGTGLCGQTCNVAVVIDHSKYLNRILELDPEKGFAWVEPGVILDQLREQAENYHLTFGPDPATHTHNTLGGMIGNNSCGVHSVMAGRTVDNILELDVITYDGVRITVGETTDLELEEIIAQGGRRGEIYAGLKSIRDRQAKRIRERYPKIPRRVSGYNLDELLPENGFNVAHALVGTEGTCVTILAAKVRLVHSPPARSILLLGYPDVYSAGDHVPEILKFEPVGLEGLDDLLVKFMQKKKLHPEDIELLPPGKGWLLVEFGGETEEESDQKAKDAMEALKKLKDPPSMKLFIDEKEEKRIWEVRESGLGATANVPGFPLSWPGWEDAAVAPDKIGGYLREFRKLLDRHGLNASLYGHFGDGCIHCRISFDLFSAEGVANFTSFLDHASDLVVSYGGSFSAEHGDGQSKALYLRKMYGDELIEAFRQFKGLWDPQWKMNPGKVVDPYHPDQNLRLGVTYDPWQPETRFRFPTDETSFARATLRCVGVGECRRTHNAFMCPSFQATREEQHTTRGRAHLLFEMFRRDFIKDGWRSVEVRDALELCLSCKGCKGECPVNVDMAAYKAEFLHHHYHNRLRPRPAYSMGLFGIWGRLGAGMPRLANLVSHATLLSGVVKWIGGIASQRSMPTFAPESFTSAYRRQEKQPEQKGKEVVLYPDIFNDCFYPEILHAACEVLERFGYQVIVPDQNPPAVRPPMDYGMLDYAMKRMEEVIDQLSPYVRRGIPVVILEPSTAAVFRDELPELLPEHQDGKRLTAHTFLMSEFVLREGLTPPNLPGKVLLQAHCHEKSVLSLHAKAAHELLAKMGLSVEEPEKGCCGMAGSFGFESGKYEVSMKIAEANLLPAVREAGAETYIVADGFSCRTQIQQGAGKRALHTAELLHLAFTRTLLPPPAK
ncbi:FAD-dependent oxidase [Citrifermentans bemidjiense Bem]|uniref:FAD-dependent oxidase n=1 Tax=Citrifermentans bemidjiense (strain ATCC BAA-1014 / DSM 16622 / JCM 12645 / Bem) TaxID=404380 RepID=B5EA22_CITBB|nr:FAD-binding and (Fe-S)-binding domain-containing protein [Citrifermentans bemidjiense]ACH37320.1 FAD-dependent oxidase [Citrifermentans bemidjiense Bem]